MTPHAGFMLMEEIAPRLKAASIYLPRVGADDPEELYLDWEDFLLAGDAMTGLMIGAFARGDTMRDLKGVTGLSDSGISARKRQMADRLLEYFGADSLDACLADAGREPVWMADLIAGREAEACQYRPMFSPL